MNKKSPLIRWFGIDLLLIFSVFGLIALGVVFIYSSGVTSTGQQVSLEWIKQLVWSVSGILLMFFFLFFDYRILFRYSFVMYIVSIALLILVLLAGKYVKGTRAWLGIGIFTIQPSEFCKISLIVMLATWFTNQQNSNSKLKVWLGASAITLIPFMLVLLQPDLGTTIVYIPILFGIAFVARVNWKFLLFPILVILLTVTGVLGYAWNVYIGNQSIVFYRFVTEITMMKAFMLALGFIFLVLLIGWLIFKKKMYAYFMYSLGIIIFAYLGLLLSTKLIKQYQMMRLVVFLDPQIDPKGAGWHIIQSITAIGSGGTMGKGFLGGTHSHNKYLPEQSTDFIFSILAEEIGFAGGVLVFSLFTIILLRALYISYTSCDRFGSYLSRWYCQYDILPCCSERWYGNRDNAYYGDTIIFPFIWRLISLDSHDSYRFAFVCLLS